MHHFLFRIWRQFRKDFVKTQVATRRPVHDRLALEMLEDRLTPSTIQANAILNGSVDVAGTGLSGATVGLQGLTTTGRQVSYQAITNSSGNYSFTQLLPGNYNLTQTPPTGFVGGLPGITGVTLTQGQTLSDQKLGIAGLAPEFVSLGYFLSDSAAVFQPLQPSAGAGKTTGFTLDTDTVLGAQTVTTGTPSYINLPTYFYDPDTTNPVVTFNTTLGAIEVDLDAKDDPVTVTNFLDYIDSGDFTDGIFNRLSNLSQTSAESPAPKPYQVLQGGGFNYTATGSTVTGFTALTPFQSIPNESNDSTSPNAMGTLAMARGSAANSATSQFFFNLTNNTKDLAGTPGNGYAVFGKVANAASLNVLEQYASQYTPNDQTGNTALASGVASNFYALPLSNGFTPTANTAGLGAATSNIAGITSVTVTTPSKGDLTYSVTSSNTSAITATLGQNTSASTFSADQLQLSVANGATTGSNSTITLTVSDAKGETITSHFVATVAAS